MFEQEVLNAHNLERERYNREPLRYCHECETAAREWGEVLAKECKFEHGNLESYHSDMGQNLALGGKNFDVAKAVRKWMEEELVYDFSCSGYQKGLGHFLQIISTDATHVGAAVVQYGNRKLVVCHYHPQGYGIYPQTGESSRFSKQS